METKISRFEALEMRENIFLKNRVVIPAMASETATTDGLVTAKTLQHYQNLTQARPGLLIVEYSFIHPSGRSEENQLGISNNSQIEGLAQIAQIIHNSGGLAGIQLTHSGGKSKRSLTGGVLMSPSGIDVPVKGQESEVPDLMNLEDIEFWKNSFVAASDRAVSAGFDLIELHSAHGYGLNQWLSPLTNQREDHYGRDLDGRIRLLKEIIHAIRTRHPRLLISVRIPGQDFLAGGLTIGDAVLIAKDLEAANVDIINVSSGLGGWRRPLVRTGEGYLVSDAAKIQENILIPVIGVGGIETGTYIDRALKLKQFSLAAVGRAILKNPRQWKEENMKTNEEQIKETIQTYVDGYLHAESTLVEKAFFEETRLYSVDQGKLDKTEMSDWLQNLTQRKSRSDIRKAKLEIGFIDITEQSAMAKIILNFEKRVFTDYLSLLQLKDGWQIVGKIYSVRESI